MKNSLLIIFAVLLFTLSAHAQINLHGTLANAPLNSVRQMTLEFWNVDRWQQIETPYLQPDNSFTLQLEAPIPGQYRLRMWSQAKMWNDFIVADSAMADTALVFDLDYNRLDGSPAKISGSPANALYFELMTAQWQANQLRDSTSHSSADQLEAMQAKINRFCLDLVARHGKTLLGDIALLLYEPRKADYPGNASVGKMTDTEFTSAYALGKIPFHHESILYHNAFVKRLNRYFNYFDRDPAGSKAYIDAIMARRNGNELIDAFLFKYLLDKMMDYKQEEGLTYLLNWYAPDCPDESPLPNGVQNLIEALKICAPGKIAPDVVLPNLSGQSVALGEICAKHDLTLMLFWRSTCSHCQAFEPELAKIYEKYHPLGLEVYALSSDKTEEDWREDLQKKPTPWVNVFILPEQRRDVNHHFPAPSTPTLIALDKDRRVVSRLLSRGNLEAYLEEELARHKSK